MHNKPIARKNISASFENDFALNEASGFPSARYFQIHFEYLQEQLHRTLSVVQTLQVQIQQLEQRISGQNQLSSNASAAEKAVTADKKSTPITPIITRKRT